MIFMELSTLDRKIKMKISMKICAQFSEQDGLAQAGYVYPQFLPISSPCISSALCSY